MTITHHPDVSTLMTCAAGSTPETLCAAVACHLSLCPKCMAELTRLEKIGLALFTHMDPRPLEASLPSVKGLQRALVTDDRLSTRKIDGDIPAPMAAHVGPDLSGLPWLKLSSGIWHSPIEISSGHDGDLRFMRLEPGARLPRHAHRGEELTLVLDGSFDDGSKTYRRGDVCEVEDDTTHELIAHAEHGCTILIASETQPSFMSLIAA